MVAARSGKRARRAPIALVVFDIDGVLTDGRFAVDEQGREFKHLRYRDLDALTAARRDGLRLALLTAEDGPLARSVVQRLGIPACVFGAKDKAAGLRALSEQTGTDMGRICYVGDSDRDAPALALAAVGLSPADGSAAARRAATGTVRASGGDGVPQAVFDWLRRRGFLALALTVLLAGCSNEPPVKETPPAPRFNLVFVVIDTLRPDHLSYTGYGRPTSPNIDAFAATATRFDQAIAQETETGPSLGSMMTSRYPGELGLVDNAHAVPASVPTLASILRQHGYKTTAVVASPNASDRTGLARGFDRSVPVWRELPAGVEDPKARYVTAKALAELSALASSGGKHFLYVHYLDPHTPYTPPAPYATRFRDPAAERARAELLGDGIPLWGSTHYLTEHVGQISPNVRLGKQSALEYYVSQYDGEIAYLDHHLGDLLARLNQPPFRDDTIVVITSDHGESLGEHDTYFAHGTNVYDEQARVPLLIRVPDPGLPPRRIPDQVRGIDILPTLLTLLQVPMVDQLRGRSLVSLMLGQGMDEALAFTETGPLDHHGYKHGVRSRGRKLILNEDGVEDYALARRPGTLEGQPWGVIASQKKYELYHLPSDPRELNNRYAAEGASYPGLLGALLQLAEGGRQVSGARPMPLDPATERLLRSLGYIK